MITGPCLPTRNRSAHELRSSRGSDHIRSDRNHVHETKRRLYEAGPQLAYCTCICSRVLLPIANFENYPNWRCLRHLVGLRYCADRSSSMDNSGPEARRSSNGWNGIDRCRCHRNERVFKDRCTLNQKADRLFHMVNRWNRTFRFPPIQAIFCHRKPGELRRVPLRISALHLLRGRWR